MADGGPVIVGIGSLNICNVEKTDCSSLSLKGESGLLRGDLKSIR